MFQRNSDCRNRGVEIFRHGWARQMGAGCLCLRQRLMGSLPSPLSSRAKPRDLQFCRLVLEMFFEEAVWASRPVGPTAKRQPSPEGLGHRFPNLVRAP